MKRNKEFNFFKENKPKKGKENIIHISIFVVVFMYIVVTYLNNYNLYNKYKIYKEIDKNNEVDIVNSLSSTISYSQIKEIYYKNSFVKVDEVYSDENNLYIKGSSKNLSLISKYSKSLEKSGLFKDVFIDNIKAIQIENINQFEIKCILKEETI